MVSTKLERKLRRIFVLCLPILIIVGVLTPNSIFCIFNTKEPASYVQFNQPHNEICIQKQLGSCKSSKESNRNQKNHAFQHSRFVQNLSQNNYFQEVGYQRSFWVYDFDNLFYYEINATILAKGEYSYVFMEDSYIGELGESVAIKHTETIRDEFDDTIYPRVTDLAGHPNGTLGDVDGDPRINILLSHNPTSYYSQRNEQHLDYSNECEMFYIYCELYRWPFHLLTTVAHEFHHLIWFNNEMDEPQFILEALAEYTSYHAGYLAPYANVASRVSYFLPHPEDSLLYFNIYSEEGLTRTIDYGSGYLFAFYIAEHYGVDILRNLITEPTDGPHGIEVALQTAGYNITFNELYLNWITALTIDELGFQNNMYGFENLDARMSRYNTIDEYPLLDENIALRYYGFHIHQLLSPPKNLAIEIEKSSNKTIAVSIAFHDAYGWHVHQSFHNETDTIVSEDLVGDSIDVAYVITTYIMNHTPTAPTEYGLGPTTDIKISMTESSSSTTTATSHQTTMEDTQATAVNATVDTETGTKISIASGFNAATVLMVFSAVLLILRRIQLRKK